MLAKTPVLKNMFTHEFWKKKVHMSFGLPGHLRTDFELTNTKTCVKIDAKCDYTNATCPELARNAKNIKICVRTFPIQKTKISKCGGACLLLLSFLFRVSFLVS